MPEMSGTGNQNKESWFDYHYWVELITLARFQKWLREIKENHPKMLK